MSLTVDGATRIFECVMPMLAFFCLGIFSNLSVVPTALSIRPQSTVNMHKGIIFIR
jgi:hypothetical protein